MLREREELAYRDLVETLQLLCREGATGFMFIRTDTNHSARIGLANGTIQSMTFGRFQGQEALDAIKEIKSGRYTFSQVSYRSPSRRPLPSTDVILAELAEQTWYRGDQPVGFVGGAAARRRGRAGSGAAPSSPGTGNTTRVADDIFAAAQRIVGESPRPIPAEGSESVREVARRLFGAVPQTPDPGDDDPDALARTLFGASQEDIETSRHQRGPEAPRGGRAAAFGLDEDARLARELIQGAEIGLANEQGQNASAHPRSAGTADGATSAESEDDAFARELFAAAAAESSSDVEPVDPIAQTLFAEAAQARDRAGESADRDLEASLFAAALADEGSAGVSAAGFRQVPEPASPLTGARVFSGDIYDPFGTTHPVTEEASLSIDVGPPTGFQQVFGDDLVDLVTERLAEAIGPLAPMATAEVAEDLRQLEEPGELEPILWSLAQRIEDPRQAEAFRSGIMQAAFG